MKGATVQSLLPKLIFCNSGPGLPNFLRAMAIRVRAVEHKSPWFNDYLRPWVKSFRFWKVYIAGKFILERVVCLHISMQIWLVLVHSFEIWKNIFSFTVLQEQINLTNRLNANVNLRCFREISKPYLSSLFDLVTVNTANHKWQFHKY